MLGSRSGMPSFFLFYVSNRVVKSLYVLFDVMEPFRMLTIHVEVGSRRLAGNSILIPFKNAWLASNTCRELLQQALD